MTDERTIEDVTDEDGNIVVDPEYAAFHDDIYGEVASWMVEEGLVEDDFVIESLTLTVTVNETVKLVDWTEREISGVGV